MSTATQVYEIVLMNLKSIPQRLGASLVIVIGIAGVVGVLVAMLSMSTGLNKTLTATGDPNRAIILRGGSNGELASFLDRSATTLIKQDPAIARHPDGLPFASGELIVITEVPRKGQSSGANVSLRGVEPKGFDIRPELKILQGRKFKPGLRELMVGAGAYKQFDGLQVGSKLKFRGSYWDVVGVFGLIGAATRLLGGRRRVLPLTSRAVITTSIAWMIVNAVVGLIGFAPGVDGARIAWEAHAFGFLFGILAIGPLARVFARPDERFDSPGSLGDPPP